MPATRPKLTVSGEVERPLRADLRDLTALPGEEVTLDFHCHEGWSRPGQHSHGPSLRSLLQLAGARAIARYVTAASGGYSIVLTREQAEDQRVLLALEQDGTPLPAPRLVGPSDWDCFLSVKDVDRIELTQIAERATGPSLALARIGRSESAPPSL